MIELAIFDLGNVLFEIDFTKTIRWWAQMTDISENHIRSRLIDNEYYEKFEKGMIEPEEFFILLRDHLKLNLSIPDIIKGWNALYGPILNENYRAMREISGYSRIVALTNTNKTHHQAWSGIYKDELTIFEKIYISSELGMRKPEQEIYRHVLSDCGVNAQNAVFFDDIDINIKGAASAGINAVHVSDNDTIGKWLKEQGWNSCA
jgi:epoxide hydrolase-like predicted phosphatase